MYRGVPFPAMSPKRRGDIFAEIAKRFDSTVPPEKNVAISLTIRMPALMLMGSSLGAMRYLRISALSLQPKRCICQLHGVAWLAVRRTASAGDASRAQMRLALLAVAHGRGNAACPLAELDAKWVCWSGKKGGGAHGP